MFLKGEDVKNKLQAVDINPQLFKLSVISNYPFGSKDTLGDLIRSFGILIKQAKSNKNEGKVIDMKKINSITERMMTQQFSLRNEDFVKPEEDYDITENRFQTSLKDQQVGASVKRRTVKRKLKRTSVKRRSVTVKRTSVKRRSVKRRSVKRRSTSVKRTSVKRLPIKRLPIKRLPVKRRSVKRRSVKRRIKKT